MEENQKGFIAWVKAHKKQLIVAGISITAIIGVILGIGLSLAVEYIRGMSLVISSNSCVISFAFSVFVGIFFGLNPALRASKLDPVEALSA